MRAVTLNNEFSFVALLHVFIHSTRSTHGAKQGLAPEAGVVKNETEWFKKSIANLEELCFVCVVVRLQLLSCCSQHNQQRNYATTHTPLYIKDNFKRASYFLCCCLVRVCTVSQNWQRMLCMRRCTNAFQSVTRHIIIMYMHKDRFTRPTPYLVVVM